VSAPGETPPPHPIVSAEALAAMYAHARRDYPNECCGIVFGPKGTPAADQAVACVNTQNDLHAQDPATHVRDARTAYNLGAGDLFKLGKSLRGEAPAKIIYHSHVDVGAYFSAEDERAAVSDGELVYPVDYLVVDVRKDGVRGAKLFRFAGGKFVEVGSYGP
jgi:proteasome lid subunit RPN8/RPN11